MVLYLKIKIDFETGKRIHLFNFIMQGIIFLTIYDDL